MSGSKMTQIQLEGKYSFMKLTNKLSSHFIHTSRPKQQTVNKRQMYVVFDAFETE